MSEPRPAGGLPDPAMERLARWLGNLPNHERTRAATASWSLDGIRALLDRPGALRRSGPAVQVAGSKGKGTTCAFLERIASAAGIRSGVYSSPHVETVLERVRVGGRNIEVEDLEPILEAILSFARSRGLSPTFFEVMTAAAVEAFAREEVGLAVYEVGLGGRLDATTAIPVAVSVVTGIEIEHQDLLGDTVSEIAGEKAFVLREGCRAVTSARGDALAALERRARAVSCGLLVLGQDFAWRDPRWEGTSFRGDLALPGGEVAPVGIRDARLFEPEAAALAAAAFAMAVPGGLPDLRELARPDLPARFEILRGPDGEDFVIDGAHTEGSLAIVAAELRRRWPGRRVPLLFACATGKRWREGLSRLLPSVDDIVVTRLEGTVSEEPNAIARWLAEQGRQCEIADSPRTGLERMLRRPGPRLVAGSFYLAAGARRELRARHS